MSDRDRRALRYMTKMSVHANDGLLASETLARLQQGPHPRLARGADGLWVVDRGEKAYPRVVAPVEAAPGVTPVTEKPTVTRNAPVTVAEPLSNAERQRRYRERQKAKKQNRSPPGSDSG